MKKEHSPQSISLFNKIIKESIEIEAENEKKINAKHLETIFSVDNLCEGEIL